MNPLVVARRFGELIDHALVDDSPVGYAEIPPLVFREGGYVGDDERVRHGWTRILSRARNRPAVVSAEPKSALYLPSPTRPRNVAEMMLASPASISTVPARL